MYPVRDWMLHGRMQPPVGAHHKRQCSLTISEIAVRSGGLTTNRNLQYPKSRITTALRACHKNMNVFWVGGTNWNRRWRFRTIPRFLRRENSQGAVDAMFVVPVLVVIQPPLQEAQ